MTTPSIEALCRIYPDAELTMVGSYVSIEALKHHPNCKHYYVDETKKHGNRFLNTYRFAKLLGKHDMGITFRNQFYSSLLLYWSDTPLNASRSRWHAKWLLSNPVWPDHPAHLVEQYRDIVQELLAEPLEIQGLKLHITPTNFEKPTLGINPGATYGSAKRWYPEKFADVARAFAEQYNIVIFGGPGEVEMAQDIQNRLSDLDNVTNLAGRTSVEELCSYIGGLSLFVTNDSGPMHVAAAYKVPTVSIFGPTRHLETSQWQNPKSTVIRHDLECAPCMKRECPLKHHECMKSISAEEVIEAVKNLIG